MAGPGWVGAGRLGAAPGAGRRPSGLLWIRCPTRGRHGGAAGPAGLAGRPEAGSEAGAAAGCARALRALSAVAPGRRDPVHAPRAAARARPAAAAPPVPGERTSRQPQDWQPGRVWGSGRRGAVGCGHVSAGRRGGAGLGCARTGSEGATGCWARGLEWARGRPAGARAG